MDGSDLVMRLQFRDIPDGATLVFERGACAVVMGIEPYPALRFRSTHRIVTLAYEDCVQTAVVRLDGWYDVAITR